MLDKDRPQGGAEGVFFFYLVAAVFYVDEKKNVNRIYVSQFSSNWHLSLFCTLTQTRGVIPRAGTDTHSLRGGIGLVNLPVISSHRCN